MIGRTLISLMTFMLLACSSIDVTAPISNIEVEKTGMNRSTRPEMHSVCKGFILSPQQVSNFYMNAEVAQKNEQEVNYDILPCYSSGTAYMYGIMHKWTILYGGVGVFANESATIVRICGKNCCKKVQGIC